MTKQMLTENNIKLHQSFETKEAAVRQVGQILLDNGYIKEAYIDKMLERESLVSTYMGNYLAIPHGTEDAKTEVLETGLSVVTVPDGIDFGDGNEVRVLIGIASQKDEHLEILSQIAIVCSEEENVVKLVNASTAAEVIDLLQEVN